MEKNKSLLNVWDFIMMITESTPITLENAIFELTVTKLDIYNTLEEFTKGFNSKRCAILYNEIREAEEQNMFIYGWFPTDKRTEMYRYTMKVLKEHMKPRQEENKPSSPAHSGILPEKLVDEMITQGLIERAGNGLKWLRTKALLAYFAELASEKYRLGKGEYNGKLKTAWKPFETLFGISGLSGVRNDNLKTGTQPDGYRQIDELFKE